MYRASLNSTDEHKLHQYNIDYAYVVSEVDKETLAHIFRPAIWVSYFMS